MSTSLREGLLRGLLVIVLVAAPAVGQLKGNGNEANAQQGPHLQNPPIQNGGKVVRGGRDRDDSHLINANRLGKVESDLVKVKAELAALKGQHPKHTEQVKRYKGYRNYWAEAYVKSEGDLDRASARRRNDKPDKATDKEITTAYYASCVAIVIFCLIVSVAFILPSTRKGIIRLIKSGIALGFVPTLVLAWHMPELLGVYPADVIERVYAASVALPALWLVLAVADWVVRKKPDFISGADPELNQGLILWLLWKIKYVNSPLIHSLMAQLANVLVDPSSLDDEKKRGMQLLIFVDRLAYVFWCDFKNTWSGWFGTFLAGPLLFNHWFRWYYLATAAFLLAAVLWKYHHASKRVREDMLIQSEQATS